MTVPMERPEPPQQQEQEPRRRRRYSRADHRARSHENAHAAGAGDDAAAADASPRPHHPLVSHDPPDLITTDEELAGLLAHLRAAGSFAYDSEFIGELTYFPKLCLIQTASAQRVALIDPLADLELRPFWELIADGSVEKVVHAGQQDIEPVFRHIGRMACNVFDTQIAAGLAGLPYPLSLSKLVLELAGARLGKGLTFSHWDQRPLSAMQLRYAADDVRYLPLVRAELGKRLDALGHAGWAAEECAALCDPVLYRFDPDTYYQRVRGATSLQPKNLAVLRELTIWRDAAAHRASDRNRSVGVGSTSRPALRLGAGLASARSVASTIRCPCAFSTGRGRPRTRSSRSTDFTGLRDRSIRISSRRKVRGGTSSARAAASRHTVSSRSTARFFACSDVAPRTRR